MTVECETCHTENGIPLEPDMCFSFSFFSIPFIIFALQLQYISLLVVTQIRGHIAVSSPPLPTTVRALHFYSDKISDLPRRLASMVSLIS